ncbi:hypothetical protein NP493_1078g00023 [Ridgeia piscesae]|uniref:Galaxin-like repeats domain-containing protein n=1 Tax=Ridgeia piscesae TaxID=27915 RepID=A0AAD9KIT9_RIDPI|nr:hypothetical protein NP493_1078g00023 [Ridgeia piscesae]
MYVGIFLALSMLLVYSVYNEARSTNFPIIRCDEKTFDYNTQMCCNGQVYYKKRGSQCCGYKLYDDYLMKCCKKTNGYWVIRKNDTCDGHLPKTTHYTEELPQAIP